MKDPSPTHTELREENDRLRQRVKELEQSEAGRKHAEERLQQQTGAMEAAIDGIAILNTEGEYIYLNRAYVHIYGYANAGELTGKSWRIFYDSDELQRFDREIMPEFHQKGHWQGNAVGRKADGSTFPQELSLTALDSGGLICVVRDITGRRQEEDERRRDRDISGRLAREMALIAEIGRVVGSTLDIDQVYERVATEARKLIPYDRLLVNRKVTQKGEFIVEYVTGVDNPRRRLGDLYSSRGAATGVVMRTRTGILIQPDDAEEIRNLYPNLYETFKTGLRSTMSIPLIYMDEVIGSLNFRSKKRKAYTEQDLRLAERIGLQVAGAIANAQLYQELKEAEMSLRESEEKYRLIAENTADLISILDMNLRFTYVSPASKRLRGFTDQEAMQQTLDQVLTPESMRLGLSVFEKELQLEAGGTADPDRMRILELEQYKSDGSIIWVEVSVSFMRDRDGKPIGILLVSRDITERKQTDEALRDSEEKHRRIVEAMSDAVLLRSKGIIIYVNPAALKLLRANHQEDLIGKPYLDLVHPDDRALSAERIKRNLDENLTVPLREHRLLALDGQVVQVESTGVPVKYRGETQVFGVFRDITARKREEEEKARLQDRYLQSQKMESVGRLAGGVAHDFNNMLGVILGHAEMALEKVDPAQPLHADLQEIRKAAERSSDLTRQLLAFARKQTVSPKVLDMNETVTGMLKMLRRLIGEDIQLAWQPGANLWPIRIDPSQIDQILANLSVNARDAIAGVGKITIETKNVGFDEAYCADHAGFFPGEYVLLALSDNGCGMDKGVLDKLFEPFFTTKAVGKGTGLGLATVYGIVQQNNGFINVYSKPAQGTSVRIYLPRHEGKAKQANMEVHQEPAAPGRETLLVVEDEPALLELSKVMLEMQGYRVLTAGTPGEAIRLAEEHAGVIHLLMTDVVMPEMNGRDLAKKMLSLYPNVKRLFMSGYTADVIAHHGVLDEGVYFLQKPFSRKGLLAKVREALDQK
jgi:two-component system, cell cycle sensor histidine kinase and response regulator CckA